MSGAREPSAPAEVVVRASRTTDAPYAFDAAQLIRAASRDNDVAQRDVRFLRKKILTGRAALALEGDELVGFGYWSDWEGGEFVSHSGLVVRPDQRGRGLGRKLKQILFESSRRAFPDASTMSLTTSPQVRAMNVSLGFEIVSFDDLTKDPAFWDGCRTCRNYEDVQRRGMRCCCEPMLLWPSSAARTAAAR